MKPSLLHFWFGSRSLRPTAGFTLVELIVALGLFVTVSFVAVGSLLSITDGNRKTNAIRVVMDNLNFALETMARDIRTGSAYNCINASTQPNCAGIDNGKDEFHFVSQDGVATAFRLANGAVEMKQGTGSFARITAPEVIISELLFFVSGVDTVDQQPKVTIVLRGVGGQGSRIQTTFSLQTTVSRRTVGT